MSDICIKVENLSKRFLIFATQRSSFRLLRSLVKQKPLKNELWALRDLSFEVKKGEKIAIIGKNGSGKTTLLRIITGIYSPSSGRVMVNGAPRVLFDLLIGCYGDLSVIDNIYLLGLFHGIPPNLLKNKIDMILKMAELEHLRFLPFKDLSSGQSRRIALSVFFQANSDFMIIDEGLAFADQAFAQKCDVYLQNLFSSEKTVIITSHNTAFLKKHCKAALWLDGGCLRMRWGIDEVVAAYERS